MEMDGNLSEDRNRVPFISRFLTHFRINGFKFLSEN